MSLKFENPPINEVVIGVHFREPIVNLRAEHIGLFWSAIRERFPKVTQNVPVNSDDLVLPGEVFPMARFWFISQEDDFLMQVQRNALWFNWRKRDREYPHYDQIVAKFRDELDLFDNFCRDTLGVDHLEVRNCELSYINVIVDTEYFQTFGDLEAVISDLPILQPDSVPEIPKTFHLSYGFGRDNGTDLTILVQSRRHRETGKDALYFELKASGRPEEGRDDQIMRWFDKAHALIGDTFLQVTNKSTQKAYWKPVK